MIKAWRCSGLLGRTFPGACFRKREIGGQVECAIAQREQNGIAPLCDVEPVAITPLAEHEEVQAALAAADRAFEALREIISREAWEAANCAEVQREIREVTK